MSLNPIELEKSRLRQEILARLHSQSPADRQQKSGLILKQLGWLISLKQGNVVMFYVSLLEEVDTLPLLKSALQNGCDVTVPFVDKENSSLLSVSIRNPETDLVRGSYGIMEPKKGLVNPVDLNRLDAVLVPGIAFDHHGRRLGRGKGYYDRFLQALPKQVKTIGLAYDFQVIDTVPADDLDVKVQQVVTN